MNISILKKNYNVFFLSEYGANCATQPLPKLEQYNRTKGHFIITPHLSLMRINYFYIAAMYCVVIR